jgi:hypothetical protein
MWRYRAAAVTHANAVVASGLAQECVALIE